MPISDVLGAGSVSRPGVCTSTTRPASPYNGQMIFETDTNRLAAWTGSSWQYETAAAGPPGLVYVTGASFTTQTSVSLPNNTFTSAYRNYKLILQITAVTSDADFTMRFRASGTDDSTSNYRTAGTGVTSIAGAITRTGNLSSSFNLGESDSVNVWYSLVCDVIAPQQATVSNIFGNYHFNDKAAANGLNYITFGGNFALTTQFDSLTFISSVASSISGNYRVYGYADS